MEKRDKTVEKDTEKDVAKETKENNKKDTKKDTKKDVKDKAQKKEKVKLSPSAIAIIATSAVILLIGIIVGTVFLVDAIKNDKFFDYVESDLTDYVNFAEKDYKGYKLQIDIAKPRPMDVDVAILNLLASDKSEKPLNDGAMITSAATVTPGDVVHIWYRGYLLDDDGKEIAVSGMCNFSGTAASELAIGSGKFVPGFELNLVGVNTADYPKFEKITEGEIKATQYAYVSYSRLVEGGNAKTDKKTASYLRIDLSDETLDKTYGTGFREQVLAATIGEKKSFGVTLDGKTHNYTDLIVNFVTECEVNPLVIECYFPYDYSTTTLRNENAFFEVYIEGVVEYDCPEFNDEYVLKKVNEKNSVITEAELMEYEGATPTEKYRAYAKKYLDDAYEENYKAMLEDAMWDHYLAKAEVKKYPAIKVDAIYKEYEDDVYYQFEQTGGSIQDSYTGEYNSYENIDDFAVAYLGLTYSQDKDWKKVLYTMSENLVKERLVLYYLIQVEDIKITDKMFEDELAAIKQEYIDEYIKQYLDYEKKTREDYTDEEYEKFVEEREAELFDYYDEEYFKETTYYELALREFLKWPTVSTLDDRRAYPVTK